HTTSLRDWSSDVCSSDLEPVRVAEEVAMLDVISGGRILSGFVRGVATEMHPANANPVYNRERFYESVDLIIKAWTTPEPFAWEEIGRASCRERVRRQEVG